MINENGAFDTLNDNFSFFFCVRTLTNRYKMQINLHI